MRRRYSYTLSNASRFMPIYDTLLSQIKNQSPSVGITFPETKVTTQMGMAITTFQQRLVDGLKYLAEKHETINTIDLKYTKEDYVYLKAILRTTLTDTAILIGVKHNPTFFTSIKAQLAPVGVDGKVISVFKQRVLDFLSDPNQPVCQITDMPPLLSKEDIDWLENEVKGNLGIALVWGELNKSLTLVK